MTQPAGTGIGAYLGALEGAGLIELAATQPELEYLFRHALVREAAYDSLLRQERRRLHRAVAETIEELNPGRLGELASELALHYAESGDTERAHEYFVTAAEHAEQRFALHEAHEFISRAIDLLPDSDDPNVMRRRAELGLRAVRAGIDFTGADRGLTALAEVERIATELADPQLLASTYVLIALVRTERGEQYAASPELRASLDRALAFAETAGHRSLRAQAMALLGEAKYGSGEFAAAAQLLGEAVPIIQDDGLLTDASLFARTLALAHAQLGDFVGAKASVELARSLAGGSGDPTARLDADLAESMVEDLRGNRSSAIAYASDAAEQADRIDNKACSIVARSVIGEQHLLAARPDEAILVLQEVPELAEYCALVPLRVELSRALLDSALGRAGRSEFRFEAHERGLELARSTGARAVEATLLRQRARDRAAAGLGDDAAGDYAAAEQVFAELDARPELAHTLAEHGRLLVSGGRSDEGRALLGRAAALFSEMELGDLADRTLHGQGDAPPGAALHQEAAAGPT